MIYPYRPDIAHRISEHQAECRAQAVESVRAGLRGGSNFHMAGDQFALIFTQPDGSTVMFVGTVDYLRFDPAPEEAADG